MKKTILLIISLIALVCQANTWTVDELPNVNLADRTKTLVNPDHIVSPMVAVQIDSIVAQTRRQTTVEVVPVVVDNISPDDPDEFATSLLRTWGIGKKDINNGILILVVKDQRQIVIRTGYGAEGVLPDIIAGRIINDYMVPYFREGNYSEGVKAGVAAVCKIVTDPEAADELRSSQREYSNGAASEEGDFFAIYIKISIFVAIAMLVILAFNVFSSSKKPAYERYLSLSKFKLSFWVLTVLFMFIPILAPLILTYLLNHWRNHVRNCPNCGHQMHKLDEDEDNKYLTMAQDLEEKINSVDYDVWLCDNCGETDIYSFVKNSPYTECPKCHARAMKLTENRIIQQPTTRQNGMGERIYTCLNCDHHKRQRYSIPRKQDDAAVAGAVLGAMLGSSGRGGGGFGGPIGGGFGGGSTGGGGARGGW